jgi:hypothetical protein
MVEIGDTIVSFELFEQYFCCNLQQCKGCCCVEGDAGAPLEKSEITQLQALLPKYWTYLTPQAQKTIENQGVAYIDNQGEDVTQIINGQECVFAYFAKGVCLCALERAYNEGVIDFQKPVSCHLYPVRLDKFTDFTAVNLHHWELCKEAEIFGKTNKIPAYKFLKTPLIRRFGQDWYAELEQAAEAYYKEFE